ncbi:MAG TPA: DUF4157 domain-containing protein [Thermoanaerobaculia bacterium]|nr:DUF4157 domain-containing protein [Thermoanaerobaculia bacterium]
MKQNRAIPPFVLPPQLLDAAGQLRARVRPRFPRWLAPLVRGDVVAITLGRSIYLREGLARGAESELTRILLHELVHVRQVAELGLFRFVFRYLRDYLRLRRSGLGPSAAYAAIPFEIEARKAEGSPSGSGIEERIV